MVKKDSINKLYRSRDDKIIAGVCGGIAKHFNIDPIWIRLATVFLCLINGIGIILYILAWILVPENPKEKSSKDTKAEEFVKEFKTKSIKKNKDHTFIFGTILIIFGVAFLLDNLFFWFSFNLVWPFALIILGFYLIKSHIK
jgi:phage shock protein C